MKVNINSNQINSVINGEKIEIKNQNQNPVDWNKSELELIKLRVKELVSKDKLEDAVKYLQNSNIPNREYINRICVHSLRKLSRLDTQIRFEEISDSRYNVELNKIADSILHVIGEVN